MYKILICLLFSINGFTQNANPTNVPLLDSDIKIDGVMDEEIWEQALVIPLLYETSPAENVPARVKTDVYFIDTGQHLVVGFKAQDPEPEKIRAFLRDRDSAYQDDFVGLLLDTYNDERRGLEFFVNPLGVQMDLIQSGNNEDDSWNAIWDSAGKITDFGYVVEMEIPYNELQMPYVDGEKTWGLFALRIQPRDDRRLYRNVILDRSNSCNLCQTQKIKGFANADRGLDLEVTPTITGLAAKSRDASEVNYGPTNTEFEAGVDINWGINSNTTLNATISPDFSQVESDSAQLYVNQNFALFFPERRSFFLENADYFDSNMRLVHTRNIADPDYGLRLVGKDGKNAYGVFYANDTITNILIPGALGSGFTTLESESDNFVGRYRRDFGNNASTIGAIVTNRSGVDYSNSLISFDMNYRVTDKDTLRFQVANSETEYPDEVASEFEQTSGEFSGTSYLARYQHNGRNLRLNLFHQSKGDGFRADSGFIGQVGTTKSVIGAGYSWIGDENNWWNQIRIYSDWDITHDQNDLMLEKEFEGNINIRGPLQSHLTYGTGVRDRYWDEFIYRENYRFLDFDFTPLAGIRGGFFYELGHSVDFSNNRLADAERAGVNLNANLGKHFSLRVRHNYRNLSNTMGTIFTANQTDLRFSYQFSIRQRLRLALIQTNVNRDLSLYKEPTDYNEHSKNIATQLIYSYKVNPRTLLFVGYSDVGQEDDNIESFVKTDKNVFVKFSYAWKK